RAEPAGAARFAKGPCPAVQALQLTTQRAAHARRSGAGAGPHPERGPSAESGDAGAQAAGGGCQGAIPVGHRALRAAEGSTSLVCPLTGFASRARERPWPAFRLAFERRKPRGQRPRKTRFAVSTDAASFLCWGRACAEGAEELAPDPEGVACQVRGVTGRRLQVSAG